MVTLLSVCWAFFAARAVLWIGRRALPRVVVPRTKSGRAMPRTTRSLVPRTGLVGRVAADVARRRRARAADAEVARALPAAIDLLGVAVGAGWTPLLALDAVARWSPIEAASTLQVAVDAFARGVPLADAYALAARRSPAVRPLTDVLAAATVTGSPIAPALGRLAHEARLEQRRRAEARARTVPVRLLFPLVFLVLPAFGLLTVVPAVVSGWRGA